MLEREKIRSGRAHATHQVVQTSRRRLIVLIHFCFESFVLIGCTTESRICLGGPHPEHLIQRFDTQGTIAKHGVRRPPWADNHSHLVYVAIKSGQQLSVSCRSQRTLLLEYYIYTPLLTHIVSKGDQWPWPNIMGLHSPRRSTTKEMLW